MGFISWKSSGLKFLNKIKNKHLGRTAKALMSRNNGFITTLFFFNIAILKKYF